MKLKRLLSTFLAALMIVGVIPFTTVQAAATLSLSELQAKFPDGKYWNHSSGGRSNNNPNGWTDTPCSCHGRSACVSDKYGDCRCNYFDGGVQCFGFAYKLAYDAYGSYASGWSSGNMSSLKAGDVIRYKNDGHSIWVTAVNGDTITYADCNSDTYGNTCIIRWNKTISKSTVSKTLSWIKSAPYELSGSSSPSYSVDTSYPTPFKAYINSSENVRCYDYVNSSSDEGGWVYPSDECTILEVYTNGWCKFECPWTNNTVKIKYAQVSIFNLNGIIKPTAELSINKNTILVNGYIDFSFGGTNNGNFTLGIYKNDERIATYDIYSQNYYSLQFTEPGSYKAYMTGYGYGTYADSNYVYWEVRDISAKLSINKERMLIADKITFSLLGNHYGTLENGATTLGIYKDDERIDTITVYGSEYTQYFYEAGKYKAYFTGYGDGTLADSNYVYWEVCEVSAELSIDKENIVVGDTVKFYMLGDHAGTLENGPCTLGIYKDDERVDTVTVYGYEYSQAFSAPGKYKAYFTGYRDGNHANSNYVYWEVFPTTSTVVFDANGGTNAPAEQTKSYGIDLTLTSAKPSRTGYTFLGWSTDSAASTPEYLSGATFTVDGDTTLYAVWKEGCEDGAHDHSIESTVSPDCINGGYTVHSCSLCGNTYTDSFTDALGHDYVEGICTRCDEADPNYTSGDLNGDNSVNISDLFMMKSFLAGHAELTEAQNASADLNGDGKINISDFYQMKRYLTSGELSTDN